MAVLCAVTDDFAREKTVARLVHDMRGKDETRKHLGLLVVGELGRQADLSGVVDLQVLTIQFGLRGNGKCHHAVPLLYLFLLDGSRVDMDNDNVGI